MALREDIGAFTSIGKLGVGPMNSARTERAFR